MDHLITLTELQTALDGQHPPTLLEALPARYFEEGHLPGALHFPHDAVAERARALLPVRDQALVVYCASETCRNSHVAADQLRRLGFTNVRVFAGGKKAWTDAGLRLEADAAPVAHATK